MVVTAAGALLTVLVVMMMLMLLLKLVKLTLKSILLLHSGEYLLAAYLIPCGGDYDGILIMLSYKLYSLLGL